MTAMRVLWLMALAFVARAASGQAVRPTTAADSLSLAVVLHTTAIQNALRSARADWPLEVICLQAAHRRDGDIVGVGDTPAGVLEVLQKDQKLPLRPISSCTYDRAITTGGPAVKDTTTGRPGMIVRVQDPVFNDDGTLTLRFSQNQGRFSAVTWQCDGRKDATRGWIINSCRQTGAS